MGKWGGGGLSAFAIKSCTTTVLCVIIRQYNKLSHLCAIISAYNAITGASEKLIDPQTARKEDFGTVTQINAHIYLYACRIQPPFLNTVLPPTLLHTGTSELRLHFPSNIARRGGSFF